MIYIQTHCGHAKARPYIITILSLDNNRYTDTRFCRRPQKRGEGGL